MLTSCRVDTTVTVDVEADGSGSVAIEVVTDAEAAAYLGDPATALRLEDLTEAGWEVERLETDPDHEGVVVSAARPFASGEELAAVLATLGVDHRGGPDAADDQDPGGSGDEPGRSGTPFIGDVRLGVTEASSRTEYDFRARLRMGEGLEVLSDPALVEILDGLPVGRTPEELAAAGYDPSTGIGDLIVRVRLPGTIDSTTGGEPDDEGYVEWVVPIGSDRVIDEELAITAGSTDDRPARIRLVALGVVALAVGLAATGVLRRR